MNADLVARLSRTLLQVIGTAVATKYAIDQSYMTAIVGALVTIITTLYTIQASRKGGGDSSTTQASPIITVAAIVLLTSMLAGCSSLNRYDPNLAAGVKQVVNATDQATKKANDALDKVCANYPFVDAAFQSIVAVAAVAGKTVPQSVIDSESVAVRFLDDLCTNRPQDAATALKAAQKALAAMIAVRDRFKE